MPILSRSPAQPNSQESWKKEGHFKQVWMKQRDGGAYQESRMIEVGVLGACALFLNMVALYR